MPCFYPAHGHAPMPLPTSEDGIEHLGPVFGSCHEQSNRCGTYQPSNVHSTGLFLSDAYDVYKSAALPPPMYNQPGIYDNAQPPIPQSMGAPFMAPSRMQDLWVKDHPRRPSRLQSGVKGHSDPQAKHEKPTGGVSAQLDYELEQMSDFVSEMATLMYDLLGHLSAVQSANLLGSLKPHAYCSALFRKWVAQVLHATRLPSATILLSLSYLALRVRGLLASGAYALEKDLYHMLTVALILGSKFLDDNTFQNKSWAEVSNIAVAQLNEGERDWLDAFNHRLHHDANAIDGFASFQQKWGSYQARPVSGSTILHLDTTVQRRHSARQYHTPSIYTPMSTVSANSGFSRDANFMSNGYPTPTYTPYDPWCNQRAAVDSSPSTAPHTGPTTPEYYNGQSMWGSVDKRSRRSMYGYNIPQHITSERPSYQSLNGPQFPPASLNVWNCHGAACQCSGCRQTHIMPRYGYVAC